MGFVRNISSRITGAYRAIAKPVDSLTAERELHRKMLKSSADLLTQDITRLIPQAMDVLDGLLRDVDEVLALDPDAYDEIFDDDQIATSVDNAFLPVAQAKFFFQAKAPESKALVPYLSEYCLDRPSWADLVMDLCYAEITGVRLSRMVWKNEGTYQDPIFNVRQFIPKDKRRFRPGDPEWENIYLIDSGEFGTGISGTYNTTTNFQKALERNHFIVHRWRNTEDRNGWGKGIGARLYRLAKYRKPLIHLFLQALENMGGGLRYVEADGDKLKAYSPADWDTLSGSIRDVLTEAKSGDTVVLPPGFKANLFFPPESVGKAIQTAIDEYLDSLIERTINGVDRKQDQSRLGSAQFGKEMSKTAWRRHQFRGTKIAETLSADYIQEWVRNNPWVWDRAGVPFLTQLPKLKCFVPGGDALKERAEVVNMHRGPVLKSEYFEAHGLTEVSQEDIDADLAFTPDDLATTQPGLGVPSIGIGREPVDDDVSVQDAAMNGAQAASLADILTKVADGTLAPKAAEIMIPKAYPTISLEEAKEMVADSVAHELPATPEPADPFSGRSWAYRALVKELSKGQK